MIPSSSGDPTATYTNIPNYILMLLFTMELSRPEWKLYLYLRSKKNNNNGFAWPGLPLIIKEAHVSRKDVKPARDRLVELGLISAITRPGFTTMIDFNDEKLKKNYLKLMKKGSAHRGHHRSAHSGNGGSAHRGHTTITNTITTLPNTIDRRKKKKEKSVHSLRPTKKSPDANKRTKRVVPTVGTTIHLLLSQDNKPTYSDYLKHKGNQWEWRAFLGKWEELHST